MPWRAVRWQMTCALALCQVGLVSVSPTAAEAQAPRHAARTQKVRPGDGSERDPTFSPVRRALVDAARREDLEAVVRHFAETLKVDDTVMAGSEFAARLRADRHEARELLRGLHEALETGTAYDGATIVAPYVTVGFDLVAAMPEISGEYFVVTADRVRVRSTPSTRAPAVDVLSYEIVATTALDDVATLTPASESCDAWRKIVTPKGRVAWICARYLGSPMDTRYVFMREAGQWRLAAMVAD